MKTAGARKKKGGGAEEAPARIAFVETRARRRLEKLRKAPSMLSTLERFHGNGLPWHLAHENSSFPLESSYFTTAELKL